MLELAFSAERKFPDHESGFRPAGAWVHEPASMAVFVVNSDGRVMKTNSAALRMLDRTSAEIIGQHYWRFFAVFPGEARRDGKESFADPILRSLSTEEPQLNVMGLLYKKGGVTEPFEGSVAPVYEGIDSPRGAVIIAEVEST